MGQSNASLNKLSLHLSHVEGIVAHFHWMIVEAQFIIFFIDC